MQTYKKNLLCVAMIIAIIFSCKPEATILENDLVGKNLRLDVSTEKDSLNHDAMGAYIYDVVRRHGGHIDPISMLPTKEAQLFLKRKWTA